MDKKIIKFEDIEIEEYEIHQYRCPTFIKNMDVNEIELSNKFPFHKQDFKYFIGYKDNKEIRPLYIVSRKEII